MSAHADFANPARRALMGPGPSDVPPRVLGALARPCVGHLDPFFTALMADVQARLRRLFGTSNMVTFPISAPGSAGMEACFANLVEPGTHVLICKNGIFGARMHENAVRMGGIVHLVEQEMGEPVDPARVAEALEAHPQTALRAVVHAELQTGASSRAADRPAAAPLRRAAAAAFCLADGGSRGSIMAP